MVLTDVKKLISSVCIFIQISQIVSPSEVVHSETRCKGKYCSDSDYEDEDAVRDVLQNVIPNSRLNYFQKKRNYLSKWESENYSDLQKYELKAGIDLPSNDDITDIKYESHSPLCISSLADEKLDLCSSVTEKKEVCVSPNHGKPEECSHIDNKDMAISLCIESSTNKVFTCGTFDISFLCSPPTNESLPVLPCKDETRQLCLSHDHLLEKCQKTEKEIREENLNTKTAALRKINEEDDEVLKDPNNETVSLCHRYKKLVDCKENSLTSLACLNTISQNIEPCAQNKIHSQTTITVCLKENTRELMTCAPGSNNNICQQGMKSFPIIMCKDKNRFLCLTKDGKILRCSDTSKSPESKKEKAKHISKEDKGYDEIIKFDEDDVFQNWKQMMKHGYDEVEDLISNIEQEEFARHFSDLVQITDDNLSDESGNNEYNTNEKETADKGNEEEMSNKSKTVGEEAEPQNQFKHSDYVKKMGSEAISGKPNNIHYLCIKSTIYNTMLKCDKDEISLACIGKNKGNINSCKYFKENKESAVGVCLQEPGENLLTCDSASSSKFCFPVEHNNFHILKQCRRKRRQACLGKNGKPVQCSSWSAKSPKSTRRITRQGGKLPSDEKFFRLHCNDCSIENKFIVEGAPDDVYPEVEVFTIPK